MIVIIQNQGRDIKGLNNICKFLWVSFLGLDLGVTATQFPDSKDITLSIKVRISLMVRVAIS